MSLLIFIALSILAIRTSIPKVAHARHTDHCYSQCFLPRHSISSDHLKTKSYAYGFPFHHNQRKDLNTFMYTIVKPSWQSCYGIRYREELEHKYDSLVLSARRLGSCLFELALATGGEEFCAFFLSPALISCHQDGKNWQRWTWWLAQHPKEGKIVVSHGLELFSQGAHRAGSSTTWAL